MKLVEIGGLIVYGGVGKHVEDGDVEDARQVVAFFVEAGAKGGEDGQQHAEEGADYQEQEDCNMQLFLHASPWLTLQPAGDIVWKFEGGEFAQQLIG